MQRFLSRKFLLALVASAVVFANSLWDLGLTSEQVWQILTPLLTFIGVEGAADYTERRAEAEVKIVEAENTQYIEGQ